MKYALTEQINKPELFTGRKDELKTFLKWIDNIKEEKSQSTVLFARRKSGKTTIMERLFNITFAKPAGVNDGKTAGVIPFYYEVKEQKTYIVDFCIDFCLTFIYQYTAFKTRKPEYLLPFPKGDLRHAKKIVLQEGLNHLGELIEEVECQIRHNMNDLLWETVREAPKSVAHHQDEHIVQLLDEFQFLNTMVYGDKSLTLLRGGLTGGYLSTAESKIAPLLISGSWVEWQIPEQITILSFRFRCHYLDNMPQDEAVEMIYKYSTHFDVPVTDETAYLMAELAEGNPFYISSIMRSSLKGKDLTTAEGLADTLEYETLDNRGTIKMTWIEEAVEFEQKFAAVKQQENLERAVGFIYSHSGFTKEAEVYCKKKSIACSHDPRWLGD